MSDLNQIKNNVISALRDFLRSINSNKNTSPDMSILIKETSLLSLENLNHWERIIREEQYFLSNNSNFNKWKFWEKIDQKLTWIDLCSGDGFKREKTIRSLSEGAPNKFLFALVLRRLNDWVPQVRVAARENILLIAKKSDQAMVAEVLCNVFSIWISWGRMDSEDRKILLEIASIPQVTAMIKAKILLATSGPMALILSQLSCIDILDESLIEIAKNAIQPSVRAKAYRYLLEEKAVWLSERKWVWTDKRYCKGKIQPILCERAISTSITLLEGLSLSANDRSSIVRWVSSEILLKNLKSIEFNKAMELNEIFLNDKSPSILERGKFIKQQLLVGTPSS